MAGLKATAAALALLLAASCGGGAGDAEVSGAPGTTTSSAVGDGGATAAQGDAANGTDEVAGQSEGSAAAPGENGVTPTTTTGGQPASGSDAQSTQPVTPLEVTLAHPCVKAGGEQTITIKSPPKSAAGYDSYYADGKSGISEGFYGGNNGTPMPPEGTWSDTWTIAPHAPKGRVRVQVQSIKVGHRVNTQSVFYELVGATDPCP